MSKKAAISGVTSGIRRGVGYIMQGYSVNMTLNPTLRSAKAKAESLISHGA